MPGKIRVLYFISSLEQGGAERQMAELVCGLDLDRYEPRLALCNTSDQLGYALPVGRVHDLRAPLGPTPATLLRLIAVLRRERPQLVHTYMGHPNVYGRLAVALTGIGRAVGSVRCTRLPRQAIAHERATRRLAHATIVNSVGIRDELVARAHVPAGRIDVVENGVDVDRFRPLDPPAREAARRRFAMRGTAVVVPGRLAEQKNQKAIVEALAGLRGRGALPADLEVLFAGRQEASTRYGDELRALVADRGLGGHVRFLGVVRDVEALLGAADVMLLPSEYEGLPNAVLEAMSCGTPAIVTPAANADGLVHPGEEGLVCRDTSAGAVADALERFLALAPGGRAAMGRAGRAHATARFTIPRMVARTCEVYERVLRARP